MTTTDVQRAQLEDYVDEEPGLVQNLGAISSMSSGTRFLYVLRVPI